MTFPIIQQPMLPPNTIVPTNEDLYVPYFNRLYEDIASAVNTRDPKQFPFGITDTPQDIPNLPNFGSFLVCISGVDSTLPTHTYALNKADSAAAGSVASLGSQVGTGAWAGNIVTITAAATNFQIAHDRANVTGNFNIRIIGTQG